MRARGGRRERFAPRRPVASAGKRRNAGTKAAMTSLTNDEIENGLRELVRAEYLVGWYSWMGIERRPWALRPGPGGHRPAEGVCVTYLGEAVTAYVALAADVI